jgi:hypothetical protein
MSELLDLSTEYQILVIVIIVVIMKASLKTEEFKI